MLESFVNVPLSDLLLDVRNARLKDEQASQQETILALAKQQGPRLLKLASSIVEHGLDPTSLPVVVKAQDTEGYVVLEGNRRVVALKALETPSLVSPALNRSGQKQLGQLAKLFAKNPISSLSCVLFPSEEDAIHWITLRHTGQNDGEGLVEWGADEKDRYSARHRGGSRSPAGQIIDFVEQFGSLSDEARESNKGIITNLSRLLSTPEVRQVLGLEISDGKVSSYFPREEVVKGLTKVVEDLKAGRTSVKDIYHSADRIRYAESLSPQQLPDSKTRFTDPVPLEGLAQSSSVLPKPSAKKRSKKSKAISPKKQRTTTIPSDFDLDITPPRIYAIFRELKSLSTEEYPNACSVILRVFLELSVDHYISSNSILADHDRQKYPLSKRLKVVVDDLNKKGKLDSQLKKAMHKVADSTFFPAASTPTFNQYVHNQYVYPKPAEIRTAWDELQPFLEQLWS